MNIRLLATVFLLTLSCISGCEYAPTETNFHDIKVTTPEIQFVFTDSTKLIVLRGYANVSIQASLGDYPFKMSEIYVDSALYGRGGAMNFILDTQRYRDGYHTVRVLFYVGTNTGSLADRAGAEAFVLERTFRTYFFNESVQAPVIRQMRSRNGAMCVSWDAYRKVGFEKYTVRKEGVIVAEPTDANDTVYVDKSFIGGTANYKVDLTVAGTLFAGSPQQVYVPATARFDCLTIDSSKILLSWTRNSFDSAFVSYRLYRSQRSSTERELIAEIQSIADTSFLDAAPPFGADLTYSVAVAPSTRTIDAFPSAIGRAFSTPTNSHIEYVPATDKLYAPWREADFTFGGKTHFILYNGTTFVQEQSWNSAGDPPENNEGWCDVSARGQYFYFIYKAYLIPSNSDYQPIVSRANPLTFDYHYTDLSILTALLPDTIRVLHSVSVADNNRLAAVVSTLHTGVQIALFDMGTTKRLAWTPALGASPEGAHNIQISSDGQYIINGNWLYQFTGDTLTSVGSLKSGARFMGDQNRIVQLEGRLLDVLDVPSLGVVQTTILNSQAKLTDYDPKTGYAGCESSVSGQYFVVDPIQARTVKAVRTYGSGFRFQNGTLFSSRRFLRLDL